MNKGVKIICGKTQKGGATKRVWETESCTPVELVEWLPEFIWDKMNQIKPMALWEATELMYRDLGDNTSNLTD